MAMTRLVGLDILDFFRQGQGNTDFFFLSRSAYKVKYSFSKNKKGKKCFFMFKAGIGTRLSPKSFLRLNFANSRLNID